MKTPHKSQAAAMDRAGELPDGELSMSMVVNREDFDAYVKRKTLEKAAPNLLYAVDLCLYFLVNNYPEHADPEEPCDMESVCRECEEGGCIQMRINACRSAMALAKGEKS